MSTVIERPVEPGRDIGGLRGSKNPIKLVSCIIRVEKLDAVTESLNKLNLVGGMTVTDVRGTGQEKPGMELYRGGRFAEAYHPRVKVELVVEASDVPQIEKVISDVARTGEIGDGKVFLHRVSDMMRVRTGEKGISAL